MATIPLKPVKSSSFQAVGYDEEKRILAVQFPGGVYHYADVPKEVYDSLLAAESLGKFFALHIKPKYAAAKLPAVKGESDAKPSH